MWWVKCQITYQVRFEKINIDWIHQTIMFLSCLPQVYHSLFWPLEWTVPGRDNNTCYAKVICNKLDSVSSKPKCVCVQYIHNLFGPARRLIFYLSWLRPALSVNVSIVLIDLITSERLFDVCCVGFLVTAVSANDSLWIMKLHPQFKREFIEEIPQHFSSSFELLYYLQSWFRLLDFCVVGVFLPCAFCSVQMLVCLAETCKTSWS